MDELATTLTAEEFIMIRRALEAYHVHLMSLQKHSANSSRQNEIERVESLYYKIGEIKVINSEISL